VRRLTGRIVLLIGILAGGSAAMGADPVGEELDRLKGLYAEAVNREKATVDAAFEAAVKEGLAAGDLDAVGVLVAERDVFTKSGKLPTSQSMAEAIQAYQQKKSHFDSTMLDAYGKAVKQYTQQLKIEEATRVRDESRVFAQAGSAVAAGPVTVPGRTDDPTMEKLNAAKERQAVAYEAARKEMAEAIDREIKALAAKGDLDGVKNAQAMKAQFDKEGDIRPPANSTLERAKRRYNYQLSEAADRLAGTYRLAIREYTQSGRAEQAQTLQKELLSGVGIGPQRWLVIFRSVDPRMWNTNHKSPLGMALEIDSNVPDNVRYVRVRRMDTGDSVILGIVKVALTQQWVQGPGNFGWAGSNNSAYGGVSVGIFHKGWLAGRGDISITGAMYGRRNRGWGFGVVVYDVSAGQGYGWEGKRFTKPVAFEIAVTVQELTERERKLLLQ